MKPKTRKSESETEYVIIEASIKRRALDSLKKTCGVTDGDAKDLVNNALTLIERAAKARLRGKIIAEVDERRDTYKELVIPLLKNIKPKKS